MRIAFEKVSDFQPGTLATLLKDAYSFDSRYEQCWGLDWVAFDHFFYNNPLIADRYGIITTFEDQPIGFVSWDPRLMPAYAVIGHNCIATAYKGKGYGKMQLQEAVNRILQHHVHNIIVTTNGQLVAAQRMYESVGFQVKQRRINLSHTGFCGEYIDYVYNV